MIDINLNILNSSNIFIDYRMFLSLKYLCESYKNIHKNKNRIKHNNIKINK